jgi:uncharacterized hydrophobic protein (TIGR00271 family)
LAVAVSSDDLTRLRGQLFFDGEGRGRQLSRFWLLLSLAAVIASAGVVGDSTATVIGAMIVAPLMTPILGVALAIVLGDRRHVLRCVLLVLTGATAVIAVAWLMGLAIGYDVVAATNSQVAARVSPRVIDLVAALATGAVGAVALARADISDTLPGVAIAISLVPPLAVAGLTFESGAPHEAAGALVLFLTNVAAIIVSGTAVLALYRVHRLGAATATATLRRSPVVAVVAVLLVAVLVPLTLEFAPSRREPARHSRCHHRLSPVGRGRWLDGVVGDPSHAALLRRNDRPRASPVARAVGSFLELCRHRPTTRVSVARAVALRAACDVQLALGPASPRCRRRPRGRPSAP